MADLTAQEAVKEARKILKRPWAMMQVSYASLYPKGRDFNLWKIAIAKQKTKSHFDYEVIARGRTLRSCLAKLKKEAGE